MPTVKAVASSFHPANHTRTVPSCDVCESVYQFHVSGLNSYLVALVSLEQTLKHGGGVCGAGLLVLDCFLEVLNSIATFPDFFKLPG